MFFYEKDLKKTRERLIKEGKENGAAIYPIDFESLNIKKEGKLSGIPYAIKNNYAINNVEINASSKLLKNFL